MRSNLCRSPRTRGSVRRTLPISRWFVDRPASATLAIEQRGSVAKMPADPIYDELPLSRVWDSLRGDPRFEKVMAETAKPVKLD